MPGFIEWNTLLERGRKVMNRVVVVTCDMGTVPPLRRPVDTTYSLCSFLSHEDSLVNSAETMDTILCCGSSPVVFVMEFVKYIQYRMLMYILNPSSHIYFSPSLLASESYYSFNRSHQSTSIGIMYLTSHIGEMALHIAYVLGLSKLRKSK